MGLGTEREECILQTIHNSSETRQLCVENGVEGVVHLDWYAGENDAARSIAVDGTEFAEALEEELGWTIVAQELPSVEVDRLPNGRRDYNVWGVMAQYSPQAEDNLRRALAYLAVARHQQEHQTEEQEKIEALASFVHSKVKVSGDMAEEIGRVLVEAGIGLPADNDNEEEN